MKIRVIVPVTTKEFVAATGPQYAAAARPDAEISVVGLDRGPASLESDYEDALAVPDILAKVRAAEAAMHLAAILAHRFSVLTVLERDIPLFDRLAQLYGLGSNLASVRPVNIPVLELDRDRERLMEALVDQSARAVAEDGSHIIFFGCTGMMGSAQQVEQALAERGCAVPVIDPSLAALKLAEGLGDTGLSHSKRTYPPPPPKEVVGYPQAPHAVGGSVTANPASDGPAQKLLAPVPGASSHPGELRRRARIRVIIPIVRTYPHELRGGMQQRVMIALALASNASLLIADEPTTALDVTIQAQILTLLTQLKESRGLSILLITHNLGVVAETCDRVAVLYVGHVVEQGRTRDIFKEMKHSYTQGLLAAIPRPGSHGQPLQAISGSVPSGLVVFPGCPFEPRCSFAMEVCRQEFPPLVRVGEEHYVACYQFVAW